MAGDTSSTRKQWLEIVTKSQRKEQVPAFKPGDQVRVWTKILERDRARQVPFEGVVVRRRGGGPSETFTVRRVTHGEGVERIFPLQGSTLERIEVLRRTKVKRSRLYFLRTRIGKTRFADADQQPTADTSAPKAAA